jgi:S1-C subfamily serine protease
LIAGVEPYSPADDAGLRRGDVIEQIDGNVVDDPSQVASHVKDKKPGNRIAVTLNRYGRQFQVGVDVDERPS